MMKLRLNLPLCVSLQKMCIFYIRPWNKLLYLVHNPAKAIFGIFGSPTEIFLYAPDGFVLNTLIDP